MYFWLLIIEGALRKWVLPQLSTPLLLVRDPVLLFIYWMAFRWGRIKSDKLSALCILSLPIILLALIQIALGTNTVLIALYGLRSYLLHLPLVLIIAEVFTLEDVRQIGRWVLILSVPIALLMLAQYRASDTSWLNAGAGTDGGQIRSAGGHVRASGPFSFSTGITCYFPICQAFLFYALSHPKTWPKWILMPSALAVIIAVPLSASRTLLFMTVIVAAFAVFSGFRTLQGFGRLVQVFLVIIIATIAAYQVPLVQDAVQTFEDRWQAAADNEGDLGDTLSTRVLDVIAGAFDLARSESWVGEGIGMGSNVAAYLQTGSLTFLLAEMEWQRVILEFGPILGLGFMVFRILISVDMFLSGLHALKRYSSLSWLLAAATVPTLLFQAMEQPTNLGFMVFGAGLCFAAANPPGSLRHCRRVRSDRKNAVNIPVWPPQSIPAPAEVVQ